MEKRLGSNDGMNVWVGVEFIICKVMEMDGWLAEGVVVARGIRRE